MLRPTLLLLPALPGIAHARFEDALYQEVPSLDQSILLPYMLIALAIWAFVVWERGWRARAVPVGLAVVSVLTAIVWGGDGLGVLMLGCSLAAIAYGALRKGD
jgi:hypothetical protein